MTAAAAVQIAASISAVFKLAAARATVMRASGSDAAVAAMAPRERGVRRTSTVASASSRAALGSVKAVPPRSATSIFKRTSDSSVRQVAEVLDLMRYMRKDGQSVIFISHAMPHIFAV